MYKIIKKVLFLFTPETAHGIAITGFRILSKLNLLRSLFGSEKTSDKKLERHLMGLNFPNPVGIAAGFDKNASLIQPLSEIGFGFIEVGTITPLGQKGNPKPRSFRVPQNQALINRMGFNNLGVDKAIIHLAQRDKNVITGANIGKNTLTPNSDAVKDYSLLIKKLYNYADYFVINVSCPNIANLGSLQNKDYLREIISCCTDYRTSQSQYKPILLKISPDLSKETLDDTIDLIIELNIDGVIATNTTTSRNELSISPKEIELIGNGGMSGVPLFKKTVEIIKYLKSKSDNRFCIIGVGGIMTPLDAKEMIEAGADLIQIYAGFIYNGPSLIHNICDQMILKDKR